MVDALSQIYDVNSFIPALEPILDEGKQHPILLVVVVKECAHVSRSIEWRAAKTGQGVRLQSEIPFLEGARTKMSAARAFPNGPTWEPVVSTMPESTPTGKRVARRME
jgi:hypothetical protein